MPVTNITGAQVKDQSLTDADMATANIDGVAGTPSLRTLGTGAQQACAGNDARLSPSIPGAGNPSASIAGPAINGSAGTYMRSDAAPALASVITQAESIVVTDALTGTSTPLTLTHNIAGAGNVGLTVELAFKLKDSTTPSVQAGYIDVSWLDPTHGATGARMILAAGPSAGLTLETTAAGVRKIAFLAAAASAALASPDLGTLATTFGLATGICTFAGANITGSVNSALNGVTTANPLDNSSSLATDQFVQNVVRLSMATTPLQLDSTTGFNSPVAAALSTYSFASVGAAGFSVTVGVTSGVITSISAISGSPTGYKVGDILTVLTGNVDALIVVTTISGGTPTAVAILYGGTGYSAGTPGTQPATSLASTYLLSGVLTTGNKTLLMTPGAYITQSNQWAIGNQTTGAFTMTVKLSAQLGGVSTDTATGTGVLIPQTAANSPKYPIETDGLTDVWPVTVLSVPGTSVTGGTLASNVLASSLTSVGNLTTLTVQGNIIASNANTQIITLGAVAGSEVYPGLWMGSAAPTLQNYILLYDSINSNTSINSSSTGEVHVRFANAVYGKYTTKYLYYACNSGVQVWIGSADGSGTYPGIWMGNIIPSLSNYAFLVDVGSKFTIFNSVSTGQIHFRCANATLVNIDGTSGNFAVGNTTTAGTGRITSVCGTITANKPAFHSTATWNSSGVTFTHIFANVTSTASAAGSLLLDLQLASTSQFSVRKDGLTTWVDAANLVFGTTTGTQIGTGTTQKLGFYGVTPIAQRSGAAQAAVATTGSSNATPFGFTTAAQADAIVTLVNELRAWAVAQGFIKGSA